LNSLFLVEKNLSCRFCNSCTRREQMLICITGRCYFALLHLLDDKTEICSRFLPLVYLISMQIYGYSTHSGHAKRPNSSLRVRDQRTKLMCFNVLFAWQCLQKQMDSSKTPIWM
jgi:hypothetical protein